MSTDSTLPPDDQDPPGPPRDGENSGTRFLDQPIEDELKESYLTYAMSVIVSRALPDVRDGLKPSQRRILVAMDDLNLGPTAGRVKCAKISGDTSGNYHPHGESVIYPTLVRMAQEWNMRHVLIDKQGNFGSIAGLPPAAMRYTEARLSPIAAMMLDDMKLDTVDYVPTYDERNTEPTVLPSKFPNLLVNGAQGIAVGMATSIPPHNLREVCDALIRLIDEPEVSPHDLIEIIPGPDFPTGGIIMGRFNLKRAYLTGRSTIVLRARARIEEQKKDRYRIVINEAPYQQNRDNIIEKIADLVNEDRIKGISAVRDESDLKEPVRIIVELKRDADPDVVLNQLYQFSPLQQSVSVILLALVDGKPRLLTLKDMLSEFLRHRQSVIRRRTQFLLLKARRRKHTVEGLLLALADLDEIIRIIRSSSSQADAKQRLMGIVAPSSMLARALGEEGYRQFQSERGIAEGYSMTGVQADAILRMTLGQLVNLEQEKLQGEHAELLQEIGEYLRILGDEQHILAMIRADLVAIRDKHGDDRRTEINDQESGDINLEDLIEEEMMVVSISHRGYIKRTPTSVYRSQRRGGKGLKGASTEDEDPIEHLFVASTHDYLLFFTNKGKVFWQKVYDLPELRRESKGRAIVNLLSLSEGESIAECLAIRDFEKPDHYLVMGTRRGVVKKTPLQQYGRPKKAGLIAMTIKEDDELVAVAIVGPNDEIVQSTARGQTSRFKQSTVRSSGRSAQGVNGIKLKKDDSVVGMVIADPDGTLLTLCQNGYGKRTPFGPNSPAAANEEAEAEAADGDVVEEDVPEVPEEPIPEGEEPTDSGSFRYPTKGRRTGGVKDIVTNERNGPVVATAAVRDGDELLVMTARGKIQRLRAADISIKGRRTQGVRIMSLDPGDTVIAVRTVPAEATGGDEDEASPDSGSSPDVGPLTQADSPNGVDEPSAGDEPK